MIRKIACGATALGASLFAATAAWAQEAAEPAAEAAAAVANPGNNAWIADSRGGQGLRGFSPLPVVMPEAMYACCR